VLREKEQKIISEDGKSTFKYIIMYMHQN